MLSLKFLLRNKINKKMTILMSSTTSSKMIIKFNKIMKKIWSSLSMAIIKIKIRMKITQINIKTKLLSKDTN